MAIISLPEQSCRERFTSSRQAIRNRKGAADGWRLVLTPKRLPTCWRRRIQSSSVKSAVSIISDTPRAAGSTVSGLSVDYGIVRIAC